MYLKVLDQVQSTWPGTFDAGKLYEVSCTSGTRYCTWPSFVFRVNFLTATARHRWIKMWALLHYKSPRHNPEWIMFLRHLLNGSFYFIQVELEGKTMGACTAHSETCSGGCGIFLRIRECKVVLLAGRGPPSKGIFIQPPYVDQYGETDAGLRRGNPLHLCQEKYRKLYKLWLNHAIPKVSF